MEYCCKQKKLLELTSLYGERSQRISSGKRLDKRRKMLCRLWNEEEKALERVERSKSQV